MVSNRDFFNAFYIDINFQKVVIFDVKKKTVKKDTCHK